MQLKYVQNSATPDCTSGNQFSVLRTQITDAEILKTSLKELGFIVKINTDFRGNMEQRVYADIIAILEGKYDLCWYRNADGGFDLLFNLWGVSKLYNLTALLNTITWRYSINKFLAEEAKMTLQRLGNSPQETLGDHYQVQQHLGKKAGRRTMLARDLTTQELVVVKLLLFDNDFEWDDLKLFEREAETLKSLSHEAIPRYKDYFELNSPNVKGFALVQSYIEAKSLEAHLKAGRTFSEGEVRQLALALIEILIYLHGRTPSVIHRDIKPSNILLSNRSGNSVGQLYLVDFGSVQTLAAAEGGTITVVGTYGYMPPEQFGGRATPASDLFALGATLIHLLTGTAPANLPQRELRIQFTERVNLSPQLVGWIELLTEPIPERRFSSARQALKALESKSVVISQTQNESTAMLNSTLPTNPFTVEQRTDWLVRLQERGVVGRLVYLCLIGLWSVVLCISAPIWVPLIFVTAVFLAIVSAVVWVIRG